MADAGTELTLLEGEFLMGKEKYLGGELGDDGIVYGVPGHQKRILRIDPETESVTYVGGPFEGKYKWLRSVKDPLTGAIYCLPCHADSVLKIIPVKGEPEPATQLLRPADDDTSEMAQEVREELAKEWKYHGGVYSPETRKIYCIPQTATRVLVLNTVDDTMSLLGPVLGGTHKWYGGLRSPLDKCIYGMPTRARGVLRIDPIRELVEIHGDYSTDEWKWHGGTLAEDGSIYAVPFNADSVLRVIPVPTQADEFGENYSVSLLELGDSSIVKSGTHRTDGKYKYLGGVFDPLGASVYFVPCDAEQVLKINTVKLTAELIGENLAGQEIAKNNKWQNGFRGLDHKLYGIPLKACSVLAIDPRTDTVELVGRADFERLELMGKDKWEGGVLVPESGAFYCMPMCYGRVLKIKPPSAPS